MRGHWLLALMAVMLSVASPAGADPSPWQLAADLRLVGQMAAYRESQRLYALAYREGMGTDEAKRVLTLAKELLRIAAAAESSEPRIAFLYGRVLLDLDLTSQSVEVLEPAVAAHPDDAEVLGAYAALAIAYARLGRGRDEIATYGLLLQREVSPRARAMALNNRAEAWMLQGQLDQALRDYDLALALVPDHALAHWGRAVALDRSGDLPAALEQASRALVFDPDGRELASPRVFYIPEYDRHWYQALGAMARAQQAKRSPAEAVWCEQAVTLWNRYVRAAQPDDRWLALARVRLSLSMQCAKAARGQASGVRNAARRALESATP